MQRISTLAVCLTLVGSVSAQGQSLLFTTLGSEQTLAPLRPALHAIDPDDVMAVTPQLAIGPFSAEKHAPLDAWATLIGDHDGDGFFPESIAAAGIDALMVVGRQPFGPSMRDLYISPAANVTSCVTGQTGLMGDVFRVLPGGGFAHFLSAAVVKTSLGIPAATLINIDAVAYDDAPPLGQFPPAGANGMVYFSLENAHLVTVTCGNVTVTYTADDGCIFAAPVNGFTVLGATLGAAILVADEVVDVNPMVVASGIGDEFAVPVAAIGDLDGLYLDFLPGAPTTFTNACGTFPHLGFSGDGLRGGGVVSTRGGGSIAVMNTSFPLGGATTNGPQVGLAITGGSLNALEVARPVCSLVTETPTPTVPANTLCTIEVGGARGATWLLFSPSLLGNPPCGLATTLPYPNPCFPELIWPLFGPPIAMPVPVTGTTELSLLWAGGYQVTTVWQAVSINQRGGALELSTPVQIELEF